MWKLLWLFSIIPGHLYVNINTISKSMIMFTQDNHSLWASVLLAFWYRAYVLEGNKRLRVKDPIEGMVSYTCIRSTVLPVCLWKRLHSFCGASSQLFVLWLYLQNVSITIKSAMVSCHMSLMWIVIGPESFWFQLKGGEFSPCTGWDVSVIIFYTCELNFLACW